MNLFNDAPTQDPLVRTARMLGNLIGGAVMLAMAWVVLHSLV
jgi:hypothetical protein